MTQETAQTLISTHDAVRLLDTFAVHLKDNHDTVLEPADDGSRVLDRGAFRIDFKPQGDGLAVRIAAPNQTICCLTPPSFPPLRAIRS